MFAHAKIMTHDVGLELVYPCSHLHTKMGKLTVPDILVTLPVPGFQQPLSTAKSLNVRRGRSNESYLSLPR